MRTRWVPLVVSLFGLAGWMVTAAVQAQVRGQDAKVVMMDNCAEADPAYGAFGGCPEGAPFPGSNSYRGDVSVAEFFALLTSPLAPGGPSSGIRRGATSPRMFRCERGSACA